jgi:hypothetical protein
MSNLNPLTNGSYWDPVGATEYELVAERTFLYSGYVLGVGFGEFLGFHFSGGK